MLEIVLMTSVQAKSQIKGRITKARTSYRESVLKARRDI